MDDGEFLLEQKRGLGADGSAALKQEETAEARERLAVSPGGWGFFTLLVLTSPLTGRSKPSAAQAIGVAHQYQPTEFRDPLQFGHLACAVQEQP